MRGMMIAYMLFTAACLNAKSREATWPDGEDAPTSASEGSDDPGDVSEEETDGGDAAPPAEEPTPSDEEEPATLSDEEETPGAPAEEETAEEPPVEETLPTIEDCANAVDDDGDDAVDCDDDACADDLACAVRIDSATCSTFVGNSPARCEVRGVFEEGLGDVVPGMSIGCLAMSSAIVDARDAYLVIIEGHWVCSCGDASPDAMYRTSDAPMGQDCSHSGAERYPNMIACLPNIGTLLSSCTNRECGSTGCAFCGTCAVGTTCADTGMCDYSAIPETCNGYDDNHDGSVDEGLTRPCETACGDGTETCSDGMWVGCDALPELPEACDGYDDDCDGTPDDGCVCVVGTFEPCGTTVGECELGLRWCSATGWDTPCEGSIGRADETCNGLDDDCDGSTDEGCPCAFGSTEPCGSNVGVCEKGTRTCMATGWSSCSGIAASDEVCDGLDNDCNAGTDDAFHVGRYCQAWGVCGLYVGAIECNPDDATETRCSTAPGGSDDVSSEERCDVADNDCDGATDEDYPNLGGACRVGIGACERNGVWVCDGGTGGTRCNASVGSARSEICDAIDNDCDGSTDEALTRACATRCGSGTETCSAGVWVGCTAPPVPVEVCDGVDNDCDGTVDDGCPCVVGATRLCGMDTGECQKGEQECAATDAGSSWWEDCIDAIGRADEICNRLDDDCDGNTDEGFGVGTYCNPPGDCGWGYIECDRNDSSRAICAEGPGGSSYDGSPERCDNRDNDCDNSTDEDFGLGVPCTVGIGSCERSGTTTCSADTWSTRCSVHPGTPQGETCDGLDNDCDGIADDGLGDACCLPANTRPCGTDTGECIAGAQTCGNDRRWGACSGVGATTERCDALDNDCDGGTDEDFPVVGSACTGWCAAGVSACSPTGAVRCTGDDPSEDSGCSLHPTCGNSIAEGDEECDGDDLRAQACEDFGPVMGDGALTCADDCLFDKTGCAFAPVTLEFDGDGSGEEPIWSGMCVDASMCGAVAFGSRKTVWVKPWVALEQDGTPSTSDADVASLVALLNLELGGRSNTTFVSLPIGTLPSQFLKICSGVDPTCPAGYVDEQTMIVFAHEIGALNVYLVRAAFMPGTGDVGGYSSVPCFDGVWPVVATPSPHSFLQEVGHCFGIEHTFEDALCDTPPDPGPCWWNRRQNKIGPCCDKLWDDGTQCMLQCPPPFNPAPSPMDYYGCEGTTTFTAEQGAQARCVLDRYLTFLDTDGTPPCTPEPEICDTVDQDCDGDIAEGPCDLRNAAGAVCDGGACRILACATGYGNCNDVSGDGCETSLRTMTDCGACNVGCRSPDHATTSCTTGSCTFSCATGYRDCDGDPWNGCETFGPCGGCPECQMWNGFACAAVANGIACASDGNTCTADVCASGACTHASVSCTTPPTPTCVDSGTLRTFASSGSCSGGSCSYGYGDTTCANGCRNGVCVSDPCLGITCNDGSSCTTDVCVSGSCQYTTIPNDCGSRTCGSSPSGCFWCGNCPTGQECDHGSCVAPCTCSPGATESRGCEDPSPYVSYCVFEEERTCTGACTWGAWESCTADRWYDQYGVDIGQWCDDTCITLTSCSGGTCTGYFSGENGGTFKSTDAYWRVEGDDGTSLAEPFACVSLEGLTQVRFSFPSSRLHLTASSTYRGVSGTIWGGDNCSTNPPYTTDTTWVERCY